MIKVYRKIEENGTDMGVVMRPITITTANAAKTEYMRYQKIDKGLKI